LKDSEEIADCGRSHGEGGSGKEDSREAALQNEG
jgi:hypothetical protein